MERQKPQSHPQVSAGSNQGGRECLYPLWKDHYSQLSSKCWIIFSFSVFSYEAYAVLFSVVPHSGPEAHPPLPPTPILLTACYLGPGQFSTDLCLSPHWCCPLSSLSIHASLLILFLGNILFSTFISDWKFITFLSLFIPSFLDH